jgi:MFS family permease
MSAGALAADVRSASGDVSAVTMSLFAVTAAVNLQMPLYRAYAQAAGVGNAATTVVFAFYVVGLVPTLLLFGGISDRLGRRPVILGGLLASLLATGIMIVAPGLRLLGVSRVLQGVGVGLTMGAASAYLAERRPPGSTWRPTTYVTIATSLGFGGGALLTGVALMARPTLRPPSFWAVAALAVVCASFVAQIHDDRPRAGALMRLPIVRRSTLVANLAIMLAWAVTGVVISLLPSQLATRQLSAWAGPALFLVNGTGALVQPLASRLSARSALLVGFGCLPTGFFVLLAGAVSGTLGLVLLGAAIAGAACYGFTYQGGMAVVSDCEPRRRARAVAGYFLFAYIGFAIPSVALGAIADRHGLVHALVGFGVAVTTLCAILSTAAHVCLPASKSDDH